MSRLRLPNYRCQECHSLFQPNDNVYLHGNIQLDYKGRRMLDPFGCYHAVCLVQTMEREKKGEETACS